MLKLLKFEMLDNSKRKLGYFKICAEFTQNSQLFILPIVDDIIDTVVEVFEDTVRTMDKAYKHLSKQLFPAKKGLSLVAIISEKQEYQTTLAQIKTQLKIQEPQFEPYLSLYDSVKELNRRALT